MKNMLPITNCLQQGASSALCPGSRVFVREFHIRTVICFPVDLWWRRLRLRQQSACKYWDGGGMHAAGHRDRFGSGNISSSLDWRRSSSLRTWWNMRTKSSLDKSSSGVSHTRSFNRMMTLWSTILLEIIFILVAPLF